MSTPQVSAHPVALRDARSVDDEPGRKALVRQNPAVSKENWLPEGLWPDLDEAAQEHSEAVRAHATVRKEAVDLGKKFKAEDENRIKAYETGLEVPTMTDPAERQAAVTEAKAKVEGAERRLCRAAAAGVLVVQEHQEEWLAEIEARKAAAEEKIEEAQRMLAEAHQAQGEAGRTEVWVRRTADNLPGRHISIDLLGIRLPSKPLNLASMMGTEQ